MVICSHRSVEFETRALQQIYLVGVPHRVLHHPHQAHLATVVGTVDAGDAAVSEVLDLVRQDGTAAAPEEQDVIEPVLIENAPSVGELTYRPSLIAGDRYGMGVFLDCRMGELVGPAVVPEVDDLAALAL